VARFTWQGAEKVGKAGRIAAVLIRRHRPRSVGERLVVVSAGDGRPGALPGFSCFALFPGPFLGLKSGDFQGK
jgi:hypothetical protein